MNRSYFFINNRFYIYIDNYAKDNIHIVMRKLTAWQDRTINYKNKIYSGYKIYPNTYETVNSVLCNILKLKNITEKYIASF